MLLGNRRYFGFNDCLISKRCDGRRRSSLDWRPKFGDDEVTRSLRPCDDCSTVLNRSQNIMVNGDGLFLVLMTVQVLVETSFGLFKTG